MFHDDLKIKLDTYVHSVYQVSRAFPKEEVYGITSQLRRAALSAALNYVEGYARQRKLVYKQFLEIAYGSLKESQYLIEFSFREKYMSSANYELLIALGGDIGAMFWGILKKM